LQGLDPGEPGRRGAWLLTLGDGPARFEPIPLAALRYEPITVDLTEHPPTDPLDARMAGALREHVESIRDELGPTRAIACRVTFTGRVPVALRRRLAAESATMLDQPPLPLNRLECFIESVDDQTAPALPLEELRRSRDPLGLLARKVLMLERREPDGEYRELIRAAGQTIGHARAAGAFAPLRAASTEPDEATVRDHLLRAARALLDELHAQKPADVSYAAHREQGEGDA
jgi:hypothetical protein